MKCNNCGTEMESINKWMSGRDDLGENYKYTHRVISKTIAGITEEREYDLLECPKCGECKTVRIKDGE